MKKTVIFSTIIGVLLLCSVFVEYYAQLHTINFKIGSVVDYIKFPLLFILFGLITISNNKWINSNNIKKRNLLIYGGVAVLIVSSFVAVAHAIYHGFLDSNYEYQFREFWINYVDNDTIDETHKELNKIQILKTLKETSWMLNAKGAAIYYFTETFVVGLVSVLSIGSILLLLVKKQKSN